MRVAAFSPACAAPRDRRAPRAAPRGLAPARHPGAAALRPASFLVNHLPAHDVDDDEVRALRHGKQVECRGGADRVVALSHGEVVAILERRDARYQPIVVLPTDS